MARQQEEVQQNEARTKVPAAMQLGAPALMAKAVLTARAEQATKTLPNMQSAVRRLTTRRLTTRRPARRRAIRPAK